MQRIEPLIWRSTTVRTGEADMASTYVPLYWPATPIVDAAYRKEYSHAGHGSRNPVLQ